MLGIDWLGINYIFLVSANVDVTFDAATKFMKLAIAGDDKPTLTLERVEMCQSIIGLMYTIFPQDILKQILFTVRFH